MTNTRPLTPHALRLVERLRTADAIADYLARENRFHATGHGYSDPVAFAAGMVASYRAASAADIARCRAANERIARELGI